MSASTIPHDANIIRSHYVVSIKNPGTDAEKFKARWILQGHYDKYRHRIANDSSVLMRMIYRVILSLSATLFQCTI